MQPLKRLARLIFHYDSHNLFAMDCTVLPQILPPEGEAITLIDSSSLCCHVDLQKQLVELNPDNRPYLDEVARARMVCVVISHDDQVVHYGFLYFRNRMACLLGLPRGAVLAGNAYTVPGYRGRGCQGRSMLARATYAREAGYRQIMAETAPDNTASGRGLSKVGMVMLGRVSYLVVLRFCVFRLRRPRGFPVWSVCLG